MPRTKVLVSCIITTKNNQSTLPALFLSLSRQTYPFLETIVVDNFSTDTTPKISRRFANHFFQIGPERSVQRNYGVNKAHGKYVLILDSDMELESQVIADCVSVAEKTSAGGVIIPEKSFGTGFWSAVKAEERRWYVGDESIEAERFFKKSVYVKAGGYDVKITGPEDWDLPKRTRNLAPHTRINAYILHNEGYQRLFNMIKKKYYYAQKLNTFLRKNNQSVMSPQQVYFFRPSVYSNIWKIWRNPVIYLGIIVMLVSQTAAGITGLLIAKIRENEHRK